jgi:hypothetical protein
MTDRTAFFDLDLDAVGTLMLHGTQYLMPVNICVKFDQISVLNEKVMERTRI